MPDENPPSLEVLAEKVRSRLAAHGQHGALAEFGAYHSAVQEHLAARPVTADELAAIKEEVMQSPAAPLPEGVETLGDLDRLIKKSVAKVKKPVAKKAAK